MLPTNNRLTRMKDYELLFAEGRFAGAKFLTAKCWTIDPAKYPRRKFLVTDLKIGFLVSKKVDKRAVVRNRLKRQTREVVRLLLQQKKIKGGVLLAFMVKPEAKNAEYQGLEKDVLFILKRFGLLYE